MYVHFIFLELIVLNPKAQYNSCFLNEQKNCVWKFLSISDSFSPGMEHSMSLFGRSFPKNFSGRGRWMVTSEIGTCISRRLVVCPPSFTLRLTVVPSDILIISTGLRKNTPTSWLIMTVNQFHQYMIAMTTEKFLRQKLPHF